MNRMRFGIIAGIVFGLVSISPMFAMEFPDKRAAISGAFINRFAIGFLIPQLHAFAPGWVRGLIVGLLMSLPSAIITGAWVPILSLGVLGGAVIGWLAGRQDNR